MASCTCKYILYAEDIYNREREREENGRVEFERGKNLQKVQQSQR